jgi:hypothetical protein
MYTNMMKEFSFGNMNDPDIFLDENNMRFVTNLRLNFSRLADVLAKEGDNERAKAVLDKCVEQTVTNNTPQDVTLLQVIDTYFQIGDNKSGFELAKKLADYYIDHLGYYASLESKYQATLTRETGQGVAVIQQLQNMGKQYNVEGMNEYMQPLYEEAEMYYGEVVGAMPQQQQRRPAKQKKQQQPAKLPTQQ